MSETLNYGLVKPSYDDHYDIQVFNNNADIIDEQLKANEMAITNAASEAAAAHTTADNAAESSSIHAANEILHKQSSGATQTGLCANAEGFYAMANGEYSHAEGYITRALGNYSHAEGGFSIAMHDASHAEGGIGLAFGPGSHAEGLTAIAGPFESVMITPGPMTEPFILTADQFFVYGKNYSAKTANLNVIIYAATPAGARLDTYKTVSYTYSAIHGGSTVTLDKYINMTDVQGIFTTAIELEGDIDNKSGYHAEGFATIASGKNAHAEGNITLASGQDTHAEGYSTEAAYPVSHAEGYENVIAAGGAHVEGRYSVAGQGDCYDIDDFDNGTKQLTLASTPDLVVGDHITVKRWNLKGLSNIRVTAVAADVITLDTAETIDSNWTKVIKSPTEFVDDWYAHAEGINNLSCGYASHVEGINCIATMQGSHAEGNECTAAAQNSHAEGDNSLALAPACHVEGRSSNASADAAHAEGYSTSASGFAAHAEGYNAVASGHSSHAQNEGTVAQGKSQTVIGRFNTAQGTGTSYAGTDLAFIIGNGTATGARANAFTVAWDGKATFTGTVKLEEVIEKANIVTGAYAAGTAIDLLTGAVFYNTAAASANPTLTFRGDASNTLNSKLAVGEAITCTVLITNGATPYYPTSYIIDGSAVTPKWSGGIAPTSGNANAIDAYTYTIIKTAATPAYTVLASVTKYA